jgi:hypothetical protein
MHELLPASVRSKQLGNGAGPATQGKQQWKTSTQVLEEEMILCEKADMAARAIRLHASESGRVSNGRPFSIDIEDPPNIVSGT